MGDISIKGRSPLVKGGRVGLSRGGGSAPWLRGRSGPSNIKAPRGREGFKQMQQYEKKIGRLTVGKKSELYKPQITKPKKLDPAEVKEIQQVYKNLGTAKKVAAGAAATIAGSAIYGKAKRHLKDKKKREEYQKKKDKE